MEHRKPEVPIDPIERRLERLAMDREGKDRTLLRYAEVTTRGPGELIKRSGPSLLFFDQEEQVVWQAP